MKGREILAAIDGTLDQLIQNAETMGKVSSETLSSVEKEAFQKTQESLLAKLLHMDTRLQENSQQLRIRRPSYNIQEKLQYFHRLDRKFSSSRMKPVIRKVRKKKSALLK